MRLLLLVLILFNSSAYALYTASPSSFWNKNAEGYFWYQKDKEELHLKNTKVKPKENIVTAEKEPKEPLEAKPTENSAPKVFSADWVRKNLEVYKQVAWDNPTVENLRAYLYLQRFAVDRSEQFAYAGQMAVLGDPYLDEVSRAPMGGNMTKIRGYLLNGEQKYVLNKLFDDRVGVFFVFKNNCYLCDRQAKVLKLAKQEMPNLEIQAVALDEPDDKCESAKEFTDYIVNPDVIKDYDIKALPASFFFNAKTSEIKPLVQGFVTLADFNRRSIQAAQKYQWLPPEDFNLVKPVDDVTSLASLLTTDSDLATRLTAQKSSENPLGQDTNYISPALFVKEIQKEKAKSIKDDFVPRGY